MKERIEKSEYSSQDELSFDFDYYTDDITYDKVRPTPKLKKRKKTKSIQKLNRQEKIINLAIGLVTSLVSLFAFSALVIVGVNSESNEIKQPRLSEIQEVLMTNDSTKIFKQTRSVAEQSARLVTASLEDVQYLNQLETDINGGFTYWAETEYDLVQAYNNSRKMFVTNYNNSNIRLNRAVIAGISDDGSYIQLGTIYNGNTTQPIVKMVDTEMCKYAKTFSVGDIVEVEGKLSVDNNNLIIDCYKLYEVEVMPFESEMYTGTKYYQTRELIKSIFEIKDNTIINNREITLNCELESLRKTDTGVKYIEIKVDGYDNIKVFAVVSKENEITWDGFSKADTIEGLRTGLTGTVSICDIDETSKGQMFYIFINNCNIEIY